MITFPALDNYYLSVVGNCYYYYYHSCMNSVYSTCKLMIQNSRTFIIFTILFFISETFLKTIFSYAIKVAKYFLPRDQCVFTRIKRIGDDIRSNPYKKKIILLNLK